MKCLFEFWRLLQQVNQKSSPMQSNPVEVMGDIYCRQLARSTGTNLDLQLVFKAKEGASQVVLVIKNLPANAGDLRDKGLIPGSGRSPGGGHGNPLQYGCLQNPTDRGTWWAVVRKVRKSGNMTEVTWHTTGIVGTPDIPMVAWVCCWHLKVGWGQSNGIEPLAHGF